MPQQIINLGATGSGAGGDSARTAFEKAIANFAELYIAALPDTAARKQAARDMFGLGTAATRAVQVNATDTSAGALMAVGAFGLGAANVDSMPVGASLGDMQSTRLFQAADGSPPDFPVGLGLGRYPMGLHFQRSSAVRAQLALGFAGYAAYRVTDSAGVLSGWRKIFDTSNILGTVSQTAGVPTGAIIERGSNANGEYVRFADGTQICMRRSDEAVTATAQGNLFSGVLATWTFPAVFSEVLSVTFTPRATGAWGGVNNANLTTASAEGRVFSTAALNAVAVSILRVAIGRWY